MSDRSGFLAVSLCYQAFTLSDGALRMLVLLHLHGQGQTAWALALMLVPYELAGVVTNLIGGWFGARFGQKPALLVGLAMQIGACGMLAVSAVHLTVPYVMLTQVLSGVAKDLAKTAAKSYVRTLAPDAGSGPLFRATALLTGSKNATKGLGFFAGGALLALVGFRHTNLGLAGLLALMLLFAWARLPQTPGRRRAGMRSLFAHGAAVRWLSLARLFLFGSRDAWFAIALPLFLVADWNWSPIGVGAFLSVWVIGYGAVQALAPHVTRAHEVRHGMRRATGTTTALLLPLALTWSALQWGSPSLVLIGLCLYGVLFALTSSLHSWLVVALASAETTAERVGFYYAANAAGRLAGVLCSGWLFTRCGGGAEGLAATVLAAGGAVLLAAAALLPSVRASA